MSLSPDQLLALDRLASVTVADLRDRAPDLFAALSQTAASERQTVVTAAFAGTSAPLRNAVSNVDFGLGAEPRELREVLYAGLAAQRVAPEVAREAAQRVLELERAGDLADPAELGLPVGEHPLYSRELNRAAVVKVALAASLNFDLAGKLLEVADQPGALNDDAVRRLVDDRLIDADQAAGLGLTASLYHLTGDRVEIAQGLRAGLGDNGNPHELAGVGIDGWRNAIQRGRVTPPDGLTEEQYAVELDRTVSALHPTDALLAKLMPAANGLRAAGNLASAIERADPEVTALANAHPGLRLHEVLVQDAPASTRASEVSTRLEMVAEVRRLNPTAELLTLDYSPESPDAAALDFGSLRGEQREMVVADLKAYQRAFALTDEVGAANALLRAGYHSALTTAIATPATLVERTGLAPERVDQIHRAARASLAKITSGVASIVDLFHGGFPELSPDNVQPSILEYLRKIEGFDDLFGSQDYCNCEHCRSILGPAAYFVDLMSFVEEHVLNVHFGGLQAQHPLNLRMRRPDLWALPLTCENTTTLVPYLDIICEILENYIAERDTPGVNLEDRAEVEDLVYRQLLATAVDSFRQPFLPPLERLAAYLDHRERDRGHIARILGRLWTVQVPAALGLSRREFELVTEPETDLTALAHLYGVPFVAGPSGVVDPVAASDMVRDTGLSRDDLAALAATRFVSANGTEPVEFRSEKSHPDAVQNDVERVYGLRVGSLDRLHRLARLVRVLPWSIADVDVILTHLGPANLAPETLATVVDVFTLDGRFADLPADRLCALWGPLASGGSLADRHARLARLLRLAVPDLLRLIALAGLDPAQPGGLGDLLSIVELYDWWKASGYTLDDLELVIGGPGVVQAGRPDPVAVAAAVVAQVRIGRELEFADTIFAFVPGVTEDQSRAIVLVNGSIVESTPDGSARRLAAGFDPAAPLVVPAGVTAPEPALREALVAHHGSRVLPAAVAAQLGAGAGNAGRATELIGMTGTDPGAPDLVQALQGGPVAPLELLVRALVPLTVLFKAKAFDAETLAFIRSRPDVYEIASFSTVDLAAVRRLAVHPEFATGGEPRPDPADLRHALSTFDQFLGFAGTDPARLAALLRTDDATLATVLPKVTLPFTGPEALTKLSAAIALAEHLGVTGDSLALMLSDSYADLTQAAEAVLAGIRAAHPDEEDFARRVEPLGDRIRSRRRDALTDYLVRSLTPAEFADQNEIYEHFLVDTQLEGCARTSRLVAAISSVQLYVHRVLANLEQDDLQPADPERMAVPSSAIPADEWGWRKNYRVWEANRKVFLWPENYLEPELRDDKTPLFEQLASTLLQQEVNEQNVLDAYAGYLAGLEEVAGLQIAGAYHAKDPTTRTDLLHLFGVTPSDPPVYYYRTVENAHYGEIDAVRGPVYHPWQKIEVQIPARRVAPVVYLGRLFVFWTEIATSPRNEVKDAGSTFVGYQHRLAVKYTTLRLDGAWSPPQRVSLAGGPFTRGDGVVDDPLTDPSEQEAILEALLNFDFRALTAALRAAKTPRYDLHVHPEPIDGYSLTGFQWDRVYVQPYPDRLTLTGRNFLMRADIDFYRAGIERLPALQRRPSWQRILCARPGHAGRGYQLYAGTPPEFVLEDHAAATVMADKHRLDQLAQISESRPMRTMMGPGLYQTLLAHLLTVPEITVVNGSISDGIVDLDGDLLYMQGSVRPCWRYVVKRLGTTLGEPISRLLFTGGVDALLSTSTQLALAEKYAMIQPTNNLLYEVNSGRLDFRGSFGTYYREVFFHIPFLIANHLNGQQRFRAAQRWYHYIFDPTAAETIAIPPNTPPEEAERRARDRVWRYSEFRNLDMPALRDILTDRAAIEVYKRDPFNPHAIARLRLSAYQKCIVMKYIDNLLDWGDSLFAEFTMESVNEATMLYVLAADVLGPRPAVVGSCGEGTATPRTYETIAPLIRNGSPFLMELENMLWHGTSTPQVYGTTSRRHDFVLDRVCVRFFAEYVGAAWTVATRATVRTNDGTDRGPRTDGRVPRTATPVGRARVTADFLDDAAAESLALRNAAAAVAEANAFSLAGGSLSRFTNWTDTYTAGWDGASANGTGAGGADMRDGGLRLISDFNRVPGFGWAVIRQLSPVFCIPPNRDLRSYWDRVEDRLYKLRHCLDLTGARRDLALFAPEIDPRLLVRAQAAGLPLADVLGATSGDLPPYRFSYLIEKAKQHAVAVQSLGGSLLSALERKDVEEMTRLRAVHQQNLMAMTTRVREWEIDIAADSLEALRRQQTSAEYRRDFYDGLLSGGLNASERVQQVSRHVATGSFVASALLNGTAGVLRLLPQLGSPFAMKYGGVELGSSAKAWATVAADTARLAEVVAASAGLEAGFSRRREGWRHQRELARRELDQLAKGITAAQTRQRIAVRSLELHQREGDQLAEVLELYGERFSNLALYTWLSTTLQRLHREAYNSAYATARLAEQAYRLERSDETTVLLRGGYYDASKAGLAAGEQLLVDLEQMERRFIETNYRTPELDQAFSLTQIDPAALVRLREAGECEFDLPEVFFDLFYPGHYRRRIRSVRLTIPCVTGPYTNVPATLALTGSRLRRDPVLGADSLVDVPLRRSVAIATSTAQNDTGVFEFSFRDERYMPFEGAGAISSWRLSLPAAFRPFDYQTITDVIVHISYTAESDGVLRSTVEQLDAAIDGTIAHYLTNNPLGRVFSLRQEFSTVLNRLLHSPAGTPVKLELTDRHLSLFLRGRQLQVSAAKLVARTAAGQGVGGLSFTVDGTAVGGFTQDPDLGGLWTADLAPALAGQLTGEHTLVTVDAGDLVPENPEPGGTTALDPAKLLDLALYVELSLA